MTTKRKPLPDIKSITIPGIGVVEGELNYSRISRKFWVNWLTQSKNGFSFWGMSGPSRKTDRGAINAANKAVDKGK